MAVYIMGVDPGFTGAIAFYDASSKTLFDSFDMPVHVPRGKTKQELDLVELASLIWPFAERTLLAVIEDVGSRPDQGVSSTFRFGYGAGAVAGVVAANLIAIYKTPPATWKQLMGLSADKRKSCELASTLFPLHAELFKRVKDNGRAEAALLAKFGERLLPLVQRRPLAVEI